MRRWMPLLLLALAGAPPLPAGEDAAPPPLPSRLKPSGVLKAGDKPALSVSVDTDLPAQAILQVYLKRRQFSSTGSPEGRLIDSQRFLLDGRLPACFEMALREPLSPAAYEVEVVFDPQGQYPGVQQKLAGLGDLRSSFPLSVGTPEEIALEHEWGETRVVGTLRRLDGIVAGLKPSQAPDAWEGFWTEAERRLGWISGRLGKVGASSPVAEVYFPESEKALQALCDRVLALGLQLNPGASETDPSGAFRGLHEARARAEEVYASELTGRTLWSLQHWLVFVHQEYWLNKIHTRLEKKVWAGFQADQRKQLGALEAAYAGYADKDDPVRAGVATHFPSLVPDCAALLRRLQDAYDADLAEGREAPGPESKRITGQVHGLFARAGLGRRR